MEIALEFGASDQEAEQVRVDSLENTIVEKALERARTDKLARRKIESLFSRTKTTAALAPGHVDAKTFSFVIHCFLNGVREDDIEALCNRYTKEDKTVSVTFFLDEIFQAHAMGSQRAVTQPHTAAGHAAAQRADAEGGGARSGDQLVVDGGGDEARKNAAVEVAVEFEQGDTVMIIKPSSHLLGHSAKVLEPHWHGMVKIEVEDNGRTMTKCYTPDELKLVEDAQEHARRGKIDKSEPLSRDFNKRLAQFLLFVRRKLLRKASEKSRDLPATNRLQQHHTPLAEQLSRRIVQDFFNKLASPRVLKMAQRADRNRPASASAGTDKSLHKGDALFLDLPEFRRLIANFTGPGVEPMVGHDVRLLWERCGKGQCRKFMDLVFIREEEGQTEFSDIGFENGISGATRSNQQRFIQRGPFDRGNQGVRYVVPPQSGNMPNAMTYPQCRTPVCPSTTLEPTLITRSAKLPAAHLEPEHVFGYQSSLPTRNLWTTTDGCVVFVVAALAVVHDPEKNQQRIFSQHDDDISAVAVSPLGRTAATGQVGREPFILVWDTTSLILKHKLGMGLFEDCVFCLCFSGNGGTLVAVGAEEQQYLSIWDTESGILLTEQSVPGGNKSPIHHVACAPVSHDGHAHSIHHTRAHTAAMADAMAQNQQPDFEEFVTVGNSSLVQFYRFCRSAVKNPHVANKPGQSNKSRSVADNIVPLDRRIGRLADDNHKVVMHCAEYIDGREQNRKLLVATGGSDGRIYLWHRFMNVGIVTADLAPVRCLTQEGQHLYAGCDSGLVRRFSGQELRLTKTFSMDPELRRKAAYESMALGASGQGVVWLNSKGQPLQKNNNPKSPHAGSTPTSHGAHGSLGRQAWAENRNETAGKPSRAQARTPVSRWGVRHIALQGHHNPTIYAGTKLSSLLAVQENTGGGKGGSAGDYSVTKVVQGHFDSVAAVSRHPESPHIYATTGGDKKLMFWNTTRRANVMQFTLPDVGCSLDIAPVHIGAIAIGFENGELRVYTYKTLVELAHRKDTEGTVTAVAFSPNGAFLAAGNQSKTIDVYNVDRGYRPHKRLRGHSSSITCLDWASDSTVLQSNCGSMEILYWHAVSGQQIRSDPSVEANGDWAKWTCIIGFPVMGIWSASSDNTTDVNAVCRSDDGRFIVVAEDSGLVRLLHYPSLVHKAPSHDHTAHSAHVMGLAFLAGDKHVVSVGGRDCAVIQWRVKEDRPAHAPRTQRLAAR